jgi:metallophosphoesterase superfamily enzyme
MSRPEASAQRYELLPGIVALPHGLLWLEASRSLVAADIHLAYEETIGGALPLWSTSDALKLLTAALERYAAAEIVLLGDILHSSRMSDGAARRVVAALATLRDRCELTAIAGNHEGRTRGAEVLGETHEAVERGGWLLFHGDAPLARGARNIVGHVHPSLALARGGESVPAFMSSTSLIVVPALTPYSKGLNVLSAECARALRAFDVPTSAVQVVASTTDRVFPFGALDGLRDAVRHIG